MNLIQLTKLLNQSGARPRSEPALELYSRAESSVGVMYHSSGSNTGSNLLVITELNLKLPTKMIDNSLRRTWSEYTTEKLKALLHPPVVTLCSLFINCSVQSYWNLLENILITVTDTIAPLIDENVSTTKLKTKKCLPPDINAKINKRKRLIRLDNLRKNNAHYLELKQLSLEIKNHFRSIKRDSIDRVALGNGNTGNLWKAVKLAKNVNCENIPTNLTLGGLPIATHDIPNAFANFFNNKISTHVQSTSVCNNVY